MTIGDSLKKAYKTSVLRLNHAAKEGDAQETLHWVNACQQLFYMYSSGGMNVVSASAPATILDEEL